MAFQNFLKVSFLLLLLSPTITAYSLADVKSLCGNLPYPQQCEQPFTSSSKKIPTTLPINQKQVFFKISIQLALDVALAAQINTNTLGTKCRNELEKTAWLDCQELYNHTILKLNEANTNCSQEDAQTWLSTALTNLETCKNGFYELGVSGYVLPMMSNNVSKLISNTLALNHASPSEPSFDDGFPKWVKAGDRKLLQAPRPSIAEPPVTAPYPAPRAWTESAEAPMPVTRPNVVVAQDGSGNFKTLAEAVNAASSRTGNGRFVIYVKAGVYNENVEIKAENVMLVGDGIGKTIITGSKSVGGGTTTFRSATVAVVGAGFIARDITFRNTAGPENHQAVALRSGSDLSVFYRCSFEGYQDTLYVHSERQLYKECDIYGTVDLIFGNAAAVFQNCNIYPRKPPNGTNTLTAQARTDPNQNTGIIIHNCVVTASPELKPVQGSVKTFLGRPWREYSRTVYMKTFLDSLINPAGWMEWSGNFALDTLYYAEYGNTGPGSSTLDRVNWKGYHVLTSPNQASEFTVANFLAGSSWLPATEVPFTPGL